ncbi:MAG: hypothetical protein GY856_45650 [bacterium]|nr:hypothetical protein [bacterium]
MEDDLFPAFAQGRLDPCLEGPLPRRVHSRPPELELRELHEVGGAGETKRPAVESLQVYGLGAAPPGALEGHRGPGHLDDGIGAVVALGVDELDFLALGETVTLGFDLQGAGVGLLVAGDHLVEQQAIVLPGRSGYLFPGSHLASGPAHAVDLEGGVVDPGDRGVVSVVAPGPGDPHAIAARDREAFRGEDPHPAVGGSLHGLNRPACGPRHAEGAHGFEGVGRQEDLARFTADLLGRNAGVVVDLREAAVQADPEGQGCGVATLGGHGQKNPGLELEVLGLSPDGAFHLGVVADRWRYYSISGHRRMPAQGMDAWHPFQ